MSLSPLAIVDAFSTESLPDKQAKQATNALSQIKTVEGINDLKNKNVLATIAKANADTAEKIPDLYVQETGDVMGAQTLRANTNTNAVSKMDLFTKRLDYMRAAARMVNEQNYPAWRKSMQQLGYDDVGALPEQYDKNVVNHLAGITNEAVMKAITLQLGGGKAQQIVQDGSGNTVYQSPQYDVKPSSPDKLVQVFDEKSPTGTRLVPASQAAGMPGKPNSSQLAIETDPESGRITGVTLGGKGGGLSSPTKAGLEKDQIAQGDLLGQLTAIKAAFKPEYQQIGTRWDALTSSVKSKAGLDLAKPEQQRLKDFTAYRAQSGRLFSNILKQLSGSVVTAQEFKRAKVWLPNPGTGLTDGDSPVELASKVENFMSFVRRAMAKDAFIRKHGLNVGDVDVDHMPQLMQQRGDQLAQQLAAQGLQGDQLKAEVKARLADEFGLAP